MSYHDYYQPQCDDRNYDAQPTIDIDAAYDKFEDEYTKYLFDTNPKVHNEEVLLMELADADAFAEWVTETHGYFVTD